MPTATFGSVRNEDNSNNCPFVSPSAFAATTSNDKNVNAATCEDLWPPQQKKAWSHLHATSIAYRPHALLFACGVCCYVEGFDYKNVGLPKSVYCM